MVASIVVFNCSYSTSNSRVALASLYIVDSFAYFASTVIVSLLFTVIGYINLPFSPVRLLYVCRVSVVFFIVSVMLASFTPFLSTSSNSTVMLNVLLTYNISSLLLILSVVFIFSTGIDILWVEYLYSAVSGCEAFTVIV